MQESIRYLTSGLRENKILYNLHVIKINTAGVVAIQIPYGHTSDLLIDGSQVLNVVPMNDKLLIAVIDSNTIMSGDPYYKFASASDLISTLKRVYDKHSNFIRGF